MGRNLTNHSESPVRDRGRSPFRMSQSRRERSPGRQRSSRRGSSPAREKEKHSRSAKSPKHKHAQSQSQSPVSCSPSPRTRRPMRARDERELEKVKEREDEKNNGRRSDRGTLSEKSRSPSPRSKRLVRAHNERDAEKVMERENERNHGRGSDKVKYRERSGPPISRSPSPRTKRLRRAQAERDADKLTQKGHERNHGNTSDKQPLSPISRSPSPCTKRLRRAETEKEVAKMTDREHGKIHGRASYKDTHRERGSDRETESERRERRDRDMEGDRKERNLGRVDTNNKSSITRHDQSTSPLHPPQRSRHRSRSPQSADGGRARHEVTNSRGAQDRNDDDSVAKMSATEEALQAKEKEKPSFELSGKLAAETNRFRGVTLLFNESPDARKPDVRWRLYVFKAGEVLKEPLYIHRQSCYLFGRERRVADIPTDHPSCSKQHAVIQFRQVEKEQPDGTLSRQVRPYLMDLGSTNKTYLNENPIEAQRYYELFEKDTIKFGNSSREYVLLHENSVD